MSGSQTNPDNIPALDSNYTTMIQNEQSLILAYQTTLATVAADPPQTTYSVSDPSGSQTYDWLGYQRYLTETIAIHLENIERLMKAKQTNLPFFKYAGRRCWNPFYGGGY